MGGLIQPKAVLLLSGVVSQFPLPHFQISSVSAFILAIQIYLLFIYCVAVRLFLM